jgi:hypothetical protein
MLFLNGMRFGKLRHEQKAVDLPQLFVFCQYSLIMSKLGAMNTGMCSHRLDKSTARTCRDFAWPLSPI